MRVTQALNRACQVNRDGIAVKFHDRQRTWQELNERVRRFAGALRQLGLKPGDRVAILANNCDVYVEYYFAVPWAGGVVVPLNTRWAVPENVFALNDSETGILLIDDDFAPQLSAFSGLLSHIKTIIYIGSGTAPSGTLAYEDLITAHEPVEDAERAGEDLYGIFYTGGTTGRSKGVMLSHRNVVYNAINVIPTFEFTPDMVWLHAAPMFHLADGSSLIALTMVAGLHTVVPKFVPETVLEAIQRYRVTHCLFVPTMINLLINHPNIAAYDLSSVRQVTYGASPMPVALLKQAMQTLKGWQFVQGYGMTELSPLATALAWRDHQLEGPNAERLKSAGRAVYGAEVKIVDADDRPVANGTIGEIVVRGEMVMQGYWKQPELSAEAVRGGWMHTGDAAYMDDDGFIYIVDRVKDMIISGGENIYSSEVENAIYQMPEVAECAVIGIPDERWGEAVHAVVVCKSGHHLSAETVISHCRTLIAGYKCPRSVAFRDTPLPLSGAGKILKTELRKPFWQDQSRGVS